MTSGAPVFTTTATRYQLDFQNNTVGPIIQQAFIKTEARLSPSSLGRSGIAREPTGEQINLCYDFEYTPQECE